MSILNGNELPCMYFVKLQGLLEPSPMSIQPKGDTAQNQKRSGSCGRSTRVSRESSGIEAELTTGLSRRFMEPMPDSADWIFSLSLSSALAGGRKLCLELAADCGRITDKHEVIDYLRLSDNRDSLGPRHSVRQAHQRHPEIDGAIEHGCAHQISIPPQSGSRSNRPCDEILSARPH